MAATWGAAAEVPQNGLKRLAGGYAVHRDQVGLGRISRPGRVIGGRAARAEPLDLAGLSTLTAPTAMTSGTAGCSRWRPAGSSNSVNSQLPENSSRVRARARSG